MHYLNHYGGHDDEDKPEHTAHSVFVSQCPTNQICLTGATKAAGHIILDTACQRLCAGRSWSEAQKHQMKSWSITPFELDTSEYFEFGKGAPIHSTYTMYFPVGFGQFLCVMAPCILEAQIPCLASRTWLQDVGAIIDMNKHEVYLGLFDVTLPLVLVNGHLGLNVSEFAPQQRCFRFWHDHLHELQEHCKAGHVREFVSYHLLSSQAMSKGASPLHLGPHSEAPHELGQASTARVALAMEIPHEGAHGLGQAGTAVPSPTTCTRERSRTCHGEGQPEAQEQEASGNLCPTAGLSTRPHQTVGESTRQLRSVSSVQHPLEVEQSGQRLGALHRGIQFLTVATAFPWTSSSSGYPYPGDMAQTPLPPTVKHSKTSSRTTSGSKKTAGPVPKNKAQPSSRQQTVMETVQNYRLRHGEPALPVQWTQPLNDDIEEGLERLLDQDRLSDENSFEDPRLPPGWNPAWDQFMEPPVQEISDEEFDWEQFDG